MLIQPDVPPEFRTCGRCRRTQGPGFALSFAYQPIVDVASRSVYAYEALVRGPKGESAWSVLSQVNEENRYEFDQACRIQAIKAAAELGIHERLSINFLPNAVYHPATCIQHTFAAAREVGYPLENLIFEVPEGQRVLDRPHLVHIFREYRRYGFGTAIDDFGAGFAGLELLSEYQPNFLKLGMGLVRGIDGHHARQAVVHGVLAMCAELGIKVLAEGVETRAERDWLAAAGVELMQGYLFGRPRLRMAGEVEEAAWH